MHLNITDICFQSLVALGLCVFPFRPIPDREYVEGYIKAYYFPENQLEGWLPEHRVTFSPKFQTSLEFV